MSANKACHRADLVRIAIEVMIERGLEPRFPAGAEQQAAAFTGPGHDDDPRIVDLRMLLWSSLDNDDSLDLDQLTVCEPLSDGRVKIRVAVADVDALIRKGSAIDGHASVNTTSIYTSAMVFPMLPDRLSTDLTSLNAGQDRLAIVTELIISADAVVEQSDIRRALVCSKAKLAYDAVSAWLTGDGELPAAARLVAGMDEQLRMQDEVAQRLRARRHAQGSLELDTFSPRAVFDGDHVIDIRQQVQNRGRQLIEEFMIATNVCVANFLASAGTVSLRRAVRLPERWARIVEVAHRLGESLPSKPDALALENFLARRHKVDPLRFPDLSLVIVKLMGSGEYVVDHADQAAIGHFGLALRDYTHSTAPNRRYPDLITLRLLKSVLSGKPSPYSAAELDDLARHCTLQEDAARKVERRMRKSDAALYLQSRLGQVFAAVVTGHAPNDTWIRVLSPPIEGMLVGRRKELDIGEKVSVKLALADVERGFIDFVLAR